MKLVGDGVCIRPTSKKIYSPCTGFITMIYSTKHAIGIKSENGNEILIHLGINTLHLDGKYIKLRFKTGEYIEKGDLLAIYDYEKVKDQYDTTICLVITNLNESETLKNNIKQEIKAGETIIEIQ